MLLTTACGDDPPNKELQQAQQAIDAAKAEGAERYAKDEFTASQDAIKRPILRQLADSVARSGYHQLFYDQMLGASVGAVVNDVTADLAIGRTKPADAAAAIEQAWARVKTN